ncbi:uncharacterized protein LOC143852941 isoform X2 [Tasmannia lanceolata]|uniref:uncharacterized protein LOC143852941 isoform X2 n=1 Tax=Tasmannia lanceolata TaxID=3420 RepID=UPI004063E06C
MGRAKKKLTLEEYVNFHENPQNNSLSVKLLCKIVNMHGISKLSNAPKKDLMNALNSIDLINPLRSTLKENNISSDAFLNLETVKEDLAALEWQECPVASIETLKSAEENMLAADLSVICPSSSSTKDVGIDKEIKSKRKKMKGTKNLGTDTGEVSDAILSLEAESINSKRKQKRMQAVQLHLLPQKV